MTNKTSVKWVIRIMAGLILLPLGLLGFGLTREVVIRRSVRAEYPPPGKMIEVDDHALHLDCRGEGSPIVVLEADLDQFGSLSWYGMQDEISKMSRACSYDRAGILWSEPGPTPRNGRVITSELHQLLENAGEEGPYVLVAHAFGGAYARIFAGDYPQEMAGLILLESSHPDMLIRMAELGIETELPDEGMRPLITIMSYLGMPGRKNVTLYDLPEDVGQPVKAFMPVSSLAWYNEKVESLVTLEMSASVHDLGDLPLIVIASAVPPKSMGMAGEDLHALWGELQLDLLNLSSSSQIRTYEIGHYPQLQEPAIVIEAVQDMLSDFQEE